MKHKTIAIVGGITVLAIGLALFRPELLFINQRVSEGFPGATTKSVAKVDAQPTVLATGMFNSVAHDTKGTATIYQLDGGKRVLRFTGFETSNGPDVLRCASAYDRAVTDCAFSASAGHVFGISDGTTA